MTTQEHFNYACQIARQYSIQAMFYRHGDDPRIRLSYYSDKLGKMRVDPNIALAWIASFYPLATILKLDTDRIIISLGTNVRRSTEQVQRPVTEDYRTEDANGHS